MELTIFDKCNNQCEPCSGKRGVMEFSEVIKGMEEIRRNGEEMVISGGEVMLREDILQILECATKLRLREVWVKTNGRLFANAALTKEMTNYSAKYLVNFSSHVAEEYEQKTRVPGSFAEAIDGLKNLVKHGLKVRISLSVKNPATLIEALKFFERCGSRSFLLNISCSLEEAFPAIKEAWGYVTEKGMEILFSNYKRELSILLNNMFLGPIVAQFEITNRCNHRCVFCYHHSPHLLKKGDAYFNNHEYDEELVERPASWHSREIDFSFLKENVRQAALEGCKYIQLGGGGEPTTHPDIMNMVRYIKGKGLSVQVFTNFTLVSPNRIRQIVELGADVIEINVSGATAQTYARIHSVPESEFTRLVENLELVKMLKARLGANKPEIRIMNPICSINYMEIPGMVEFASMHGASAVYFGHLQTTPLTSYLLLSPSQIKEVNRLVKGVKTSLSNNFGHYLDVLNFKGTLKGSHTKEIFNKVGCLMPFYETQVHLDGEVAPCCLHPTIFNSKGMGFGELWNSEEYRLFRAKVLGLYRKKEKPFLCRGCRMCVYQEDIQRFFNSLGGLAKFLNEPR